MGDLESEPGLSGASGPGHRHQAVVFEVLLDNVDLLTAPDEAGARGRQVHARCRGRSQRWKHLVLAPDLEHVLRSFEIAQLVPAEISKCDADRAAVHDEVRGRLAAERLASMRDGSQTGAPVHNGTEVVAIASLRFARVQRDSDPQWSARRPG